MKEVTNDLVANRVWQKWAREYITTNYPYKNVANEAKYGHNRQQFEQWLMDQGCYLEVIHGNPNIKGFDESNLIMLLLKWS